MKYNKEKIIQIKVVNDAFEEIKARAELEGLSVAKYIRRLIYPDNPMYW